MKITRYCLLVAGLAIALAANAGPERFPVVQKLPKKTQDAMTTMLEWQRSLTDLKASQLREKFGKPDKTKDLGVNSATGKPMQTVSYRLTRRSEIQFTVHEGEVLAVTTILLPSANEDGPIDD